MPDLYDVLSRALSVIEEAEGADEHGELLTEMRQLVIVDRMKGEIIADVKRGIHANTVRDFSELHDHVDANCYGGFCEEGKYFDRHPSDYVIDLANKCQEEVHQWLAAGALADVQREEPQ